jgi:hypothetical protein
MRRIVMSLLVIGSLVYTTSAWEATTSQNLQITVTSGSNSLLPPNRDASANWKMAGMLSVGGIPNRTTQCGATLNPLGAGQNDANQINNAITGCPAGQVVNLAAGTFTIAEGSYVLLNKGVTLRGAGPASTILTRPAGPGGWSGGCSSSGAWGATFGCNTPGNSPTPIILIGPQRYGNRTTATALTADAAQGGTSVTVNSTTGFAVGQFALLDELSGATWQPEPNQSYVNAGYKQVWASPPDDATCASCYRVVYPYHNPVAPGDHTDVSTYSCWFSNCDRPTNEIKRISAIDTSTKTITFDSPLTDSYRVGHSAQLYYFTPQFLQNAGVENLAVSHGDDSDIELIYCAYCWVQNVDVSLYLNDGIRMIDVFRVQLEGDYIHKAAFPVLGGAGYNISLAWGASEVLIENSISTLANKVMVDRAAGAGSVVAYNYMDAGYTGNNDAWVEIGLNASHMVGSHHVLFEGNYGFNIDTDSTWGNTTYVTYFRNYARGLRAPFTAVDGQVVDDTTCCGPKRAGASHVWDYWFSFVGNVLGSPGQMSGWTYNCVAGTNNIPNKCIWELGYTDITPNGYDPNAVSSAIQDGNYDYVTNSIHWAANDTSHTLPNSFYLGAKPAFFNAGSGYTWPWVEPAGSSQLYTLPAKARYDAGTPFTQP